MKIVVDENVPFARELFGSLGEVELINGRAMRAADVVDADILIVRSVTPVNETLLAGSAVRFVGTCTIGTDHLDIAWLRKNNITYVSAPGCNAWGVVQYVLSALAYLELLEQSVRVGIRVGIVGCGNVGGRLYRTLQKLGIECVCVDPFLSVDKVPNLVPFEEIYRCDIVCVHTPLTLNGPHPTRHMFNNTVFSKLRNGCVLLNAGRGGAIDNAELLQHLDRRDNPRVVLDVWENEPAINRELLDAVTLGTPHIAGYSFEGRVNGSLMIHRALVEYLRKTGAQVDDVNARVTSEAYGEPVSLTANSVSGAILATYDIARDHEMLLRAKNTMPESFDHLRKNYWKRREFSHYNVSSPSRDLSAKLNAIGFGAG